MDRFPSRASPGGDGPGVRPCRLRRRACIRPHLLDRLSRSSAWLSGKGRRAQRRRLPFAAARSRLAARTGRHRRLSRHSRAEGHPRWAQARADNEIETPSAPRVFDEALRIRFNP